MSKRVISAAVIFALAAGVFVVPAAPVQAQGLFERLFGAPRYRKRVRRYDQYRAAEEAKKVRVKGPQYYTYRPDKVINASFASLAEIDTASNDDSVIPEAVTTPFADASVHLRSFRVRSRFPTILGFIFFRQLRQFTRFRLLRRFLCAAAASSED